MASGGALVSERLSQPCNAFASSAADRHVCGRCGWPIAGHGAPTPAAKVKTSKIWADTIRHDTCKAASCRRPVVFAQNVKTGNYMIFDGVPAAIARERELETGRDMWTIELTTSHFATCPAKQQFRRAR